MRLLPKDPPPGPTDPSFWQSPIRGPWLTAVLGSILLVGLILVSLTGFLSHAAYDPELGRNALVPLDRDVGFLVFDWPTKPSWLYALNQGTHTVLGVVIVPLLLAKLWSVIPKLFTWPPIAHPAQALERITILALVGSAFFQFATGIVNFQLYYPFHFGFVEAHYYGAWVMVVALFLHVGIKLPTIRNAYAERGVLKPLMDDVAHTEAEPRAAHGNDALSALDPEPASISRRGLLGLVGAASGGLLVVTVGQSVGGPLRGLALLGPRGRGVTFPVNKTASLARITPQMVSAAWRLEVKGTRTLQFTRGTLLSMPQHTVDLPIACVEGWSTTQTWTGVRLRDLAQMVGAEGDQGFHVESLQPGGAFRQTTLSRDQTMAGDSLLALKVNGEDLPLDHGYPARIMVPALPGVHCTKWIKSLELV